MVEKGYRCSTGWGIEDCRCCFCLDMWCVVPGCLGLQW